MAADFRKVLLGDSFKLLPGFLAEAIGGFGVTFILGTYLEPRDMGLYTLYWLAITYIMSITGSWLQNSLLRFLPGNTQYLKPFFLMTLANAFAIAVFGVAVAFILKITGYKNLETDHVLLTAALLFALMVFYCCQGIFRGLFNQIRYSLGHIFLVSMKLLMLFLLLPRMEDRVTATFAALTLAFCPPMLWHIVTISAMARKPQYSSSGEGKALFRKSLQYGFPLGVSVLILSLLQTGDRYILASIINLDNVGIYAFWMMIGLQFGKGISAVIMAVLNPRLFEAHNSDPEKALDYVSKLTGVYMKVMLPAMACFGLIVPSILLSLKVKSEYAPYSHLVFFGLATAFILGLTSISGKPFEFRNKTSIFVYAALAGGAVMVSGVFFLTPLYGLTGSAASTVSGFVLYSLIVSIASRVHPNLAEIAKGAFITLLVFAAYKTTDYIPGVIYSATLMTTCMLAISAYCYRELKVLI